MANGKNGNFIMGLGVFAITTIAFAFLFGVGFKAGGDVYGNTRTQITQQSGKVFNARTAFRA